MEKESQSRATTPTFATRGLAWACVVGLSALVALVSYAATVHTPPFSDEVAYFSESIWIAEHGGLGGFLQACLRGEYPFYTRNPGLPLLISGVAERSLEMVRPARLLQVLLASGGLIALFAIARRTIGDAWAATWALAIAGSYPWLSSATTVTVEPLYFALAFVAWHWMCVRDTRDSSTARHALMTGVWLGLAYWFKASILLLGAAAVVSAPVYVAAWLRRRPTRAEWRTFSTASLLVCVGFVGVAWPLLIERTLAKGNPFYLDSAAAMWMDHWEQHHILFQGLGEFSASQWFATHTSAQTWQRLSNGLLSQLSIASAFFSAQESPGVVGRAVGGGILLLALRGMFLLDRPFARIHTLCFCALGVASLAWNIQTQSARLSGFFAPILGYLAVVAARDLSERFATAATAARSRPIVPRVAVGVASLYLIGVLVGGGHLPGQWPPSPRESLRVSTSYAALGQWMVEHVIEPEATVFQTPYLYPDLQLHWLLGHDEQFVNIPLFEDFRQVDAYAARRGARYLVIARGTSLALRRNIFAPYAQGRLDDMRFALPGWNRVAEDPSEGHAWVVFESRREAAEAVRPIVDSAPASAAAEVPAEPTLELVERTLRQ